MPRVRALSYASPKRRQDWRQSGWWKLFMLMAWIVGAVVVLLALLAITAVFWPNSLPTNLQHNDRAIAVKVTNRGTKQCSIQMEVDGKTVSFPPIALGQTVTVNVPVHRDVEGSFVYKLTDNQSSVQSGSLGYWDNF